MTSDDSQPLESRCDRPRRSRASLFLFIIAMLVMVVLASALFVASMPKSRPLENKPECASRLHMIGLAILLYCVDHGGQYPDSLQVLILNEPIDPNAFIFPSSNGTASTAPITQALADDLTAPAHLSYIYVGSGLDDKIATARTIVMYEPLSNHGDGMNVLFGDGHVEFVNVARSHAILAAAATTRPVMLPP